MKTFYRLRLDRSKKRFACPACGKKKFIRYIDFDTDQYVPINYGHCEREVYCGYHKNPYLSGYVKKKMYWEQWRINKKKRESQNDDSFEYSQE